MDNIKADFDEIRQSQLPFVEVLVNMGYTYIACDEVMRQRGDDMSKFILNDIATQALMNINVYEHHGQNYKFSDKNVHDAIADLENLPLEGLIDTSKTVYNMIMPTLGGKTIKVFHEAKNISKSFRFIDFANPKNNIFHVTVEYPASGRSNIRPDIICFVNGIPFVIIENKKSSVDIGVAISQMTRNQHAEYCPKLFIYPQLLIGANGSSLKYGTTMTQDKFYSAWKEKGVSNIDIENRVKPYISNQIDKDVYTSVCNDLKLESKHAQITNRLVTEQDKGAVCLLEPERLLDLTKNFILYDAGIKKIMRYQQYFAINKMLKRVEESQKGVEGDKRRGGLLWHTQGSGKSLMMVVFVKALIEHPHISNPRIVIVTDRKDLDKQIAGTFKDCGLKKNVEKAKSGQHLADMIVERNLSVITTLVHKFDTSANKNVRDLDKNIFVLVDEAHRTQSGMSNLEMNRIMPNACYIGFTGTPLLKKDRESWKKFGGYIDKYTIDDALNDQIILPLIYEGRYVDLIENKEQIDRRVEALTKDLDDEIKKELQNFVNTRIIKDNPQRIADIAVDIENHYCEQFQGTGLKAQIVSPSKFSAVLMQKAFEFSGRIRTAIVISGENGIVNDDDTHKKEVVQYLEESKEKYRNLESYEKDVIDSFKYNPDGIEILIVVDKLLTGFDAPCNTILYLAKDLRDHNLLQAIARVNRLFDNKELPKTAGFIIDYSENAKNIDTAMKLFGNYDDEDVKGALIDVKEKINELEQCYFEVHDLFKEIKNKNDSEEYLSTLGGDNPEDGEQKRVVFYESINKFLRTFNECLALQDFVSEFKHIDVYKREIKKLMEIRKAASLRYADKVDLTRYKRSLVNILDRYVDAQGVELLTKQINITDSEQFEKAIESLGSNKSKAEAIAAQTERTIAEKYNSDPEFYRRFSEKIHEILEKMRQEKMADIAALKELKDIKNGVVQKRDESIPEKIRQKEGADIFYRNLQSTFQHHKPGNSDFEQIVLDIYSILHQESIVDWYKNAEVKRIIRNKIDDYIYDMVKGERGIDLSDDEMKSILDMTMELAENNCEIFK